MNKQEAKRYAHKLVANAIGNELHDQLGFKLSPDAPKILAALSAMQETHTRFGPRTGDRPPREKENRGEPLPFGDDDEPAVLGGGVITTIPPTPEREP